MEGNFTGRKSDLDRTDKLPVLTQDNLVKLDSPRTPYGADETAALQASIAELREVINQETQRSRTLESRIETQDQALAALRAEFDRATEEQAESRNAAQAAQQQNQVTRELVAKVQAALRSLHKRIVTLETYIAGRPDGWREMEQALHAKTIRLAEAEAQLAETISRLALDLTRGFPDGEAPSGRGDEKETTARTETPADTEPEPPAPPDPEAASAHPATSDSDATLLEPVSGPGAGTDSEAGTEAEAVSDPNAVADPDASCDAASEPASNAPANEYRTTRGRKPALVGLTPNAPIACAIDKELITIGRDLACDMPIKAHAVSRRHAVVIREGNQIIIEDRGSTNGVLVNAVRVLRQALTDGDEVTIGDARFRFVGGESRD